MDNRKLTVAITSWERYEETLNSFVHVANSHLVEEIVVVDDCSSIELFNRLKVAVEFCPKVKLYRNSINLGCYFNKRRAVELSSNPFVCLFDSDNTLTPEYLEKIYNERWVDDTIFAPDFARPIFDYQNFSDVIVTKENVSSYMGQRFFSTALNTCNFFVNREKYLEVFDTSLEPVTCDSIYFNYCWLNAGNKIHILKGLQYEHSVHDKSHYKTFLHLTPNGLMEEIENKLKQLS